MADDESGYTPGSEPQRIPSSEVAGEATYEEEGLLTPEEQATLSPAEQRALARKRLAERIRATIPDAQRRMTRRGGTQAVTPSPPTAAAPPPPPQAQAPAPPPPSTPPVAPPPPTTEGTLPARAMEPTQPPPPVEPEPGGAPTEGAPRLPRPEAPPPRRMPPRGGRPPRGRPRAAPDAIPAALARPTNLPTRAREPSKVHPVGVAILIVIAVAIAYFFADIWGIFFVPLLLILLWRKVDSRELLGVTAVVVASIPLIMVIQGIDLGGNIDSSYALKQMLAHSLAGIAIGLLAVACVVAAVDWRYRVLPLDPAGDPNDEPVLVSFLPSRKGIGARVVAKARPIKKEGISS